MQEGEAYNSSTRYGAGLKEAFKATLILGLAKIPMWLMTLSTSSPRALSSEVDAHIVPKAAISLDRRLGCF